MDVVYEYSKWQCAPECQGSWFECATQVLNQNGVAPVKFASSVRELLTNGRGTNRNLFITGPTNCGKTFLLKPLQTMFNTFSNLANDKYAFVAVADADMNFPKRLSMGQGNDTMEGFVVIGRPAGALSYAKEPLQRWHLSDTRHPYEMMASRWKVFKFFHQIPLKDQREVLSCSICFSRLILSWDRQFFNMLPYMLPQILNMFFEDDFELR